MEKTPISRKQVLSLLAEGKTREEIRQHFNLTKKDLNVLFKDPALKGRRTKTAPSFVLVEDEETVTETTQLANVSQEENLVNTIAESVREEVINASTASVVLEDSPLIS